MYGSSMYASSQSSIYCISGQVWKGIDQVLLQAKLSTNAMRLMQTNHNRIEILPTWKKDYYEAYRFHMKTTQVLQ